MSEQQPLRQQEQWRDAYCAAISGGILKSNPKLTRLRWERSLSVSYSSIYM
jgi:hypothetical protein